MMTNSDVTIFNLRIGSDRREKLCATRIMGVSWYGTKGEAVSDTDRKDKAKCVIRIPATATVEAGKQYISEEKYKKLSDEEAERYVCEPSSSSSVVSYTSVFPFEARLIKSQDAVNALYHVGRNHLTGSDAEFEYCRVELWDQKQSESTPVAKGF